MADKRLSVTGALDIQTELGTYKFIESNVPWYSVDKVNIHGDRKVSASDYILVKTDGELIDPFYSIKSAFSMDITLGTITGFLKAMR